MRAFGTRVRLFFVRLTRLCLSLHVARLTRLCLSLARLTRLRLLTRFTLLFVWPSHTITTAISTHRCWPSALVFSRNVRGTMGGLERRQLQDCQCCFHDILLCPLGTFRQFHRFLVKYFPRGPSNCHCELKLSREPANFAISQHLTVSGAWWHWPVDGNAFLWSSRLKSLLECVNTSCMNTQNHLGMTEQLMGDIQLQARDFSSCNKRRSSFPRFRGCV